MQSSKFPNKQGYQTISIVSLNLQETHYKSFHQTHHHPKDSIKQRKRILIIN
jgi:hypothetical protein